ncbi:hypothetical protein GJ496_002913 [Pomphorhynchus laevis]|nr:hypothetical protein GJ496_002913 [Pomphorhynchus laevis]
MRRILCKKSLVELDGDEMARIMWSKIKEKLIFPHVDAKIKYFDLSVQNRDRTNDQVTFDSAKAITKHGTGVKCATITIDKDRVREFGLKHMLPSPNGTLRNIIGGTVFREAIVCKNIPPYIPSWKEAIVIGRHAYADQYKASELQVHKNQKLLLMTESKTGKYASVLVNKFDDSNGVGMSMFNTDKSIRDFAHSCFSYALIRKLPVYFTTKSTILKTYDSFFKDIFAEVFKTSYADHFKKSKLFYEHRLIDDMIAHCIKSSGGYLWACKNYDGDLMSDLVAQGFGSLGLMTSVLLTPDGQTMESEAAHGTVTRHYRQHQEVS